MADNKKRKAKSPKRCFVVMGFGIKTDLATGRQLDLDKSYRSLIKPLIEGKGLTCVRADEIPSSGAIDVLMYQELLTADVVIADLSTANPNVLYELGLRHALRPRTTIVISEKRLPAPFDLNHVKINWYTHLGDAIDYEEVLRFHRELGKTLDDVLHDEKPDSPVYTFLRLIPPTLDEKEVQAVKQAGQALERASAAIAEVGSGITSSDNGPEDQTLAMLAEQGERAIELSQFSEAKTFFARALRVCEKSPESCPHSPSDPYLVQRLVLTTYKSKEPDELSALTRARHLLDSHLHIEESNDPETVGLAGAIEKRLFENTHGLEHLTRAINYYSRGFHLRDDRYNGINLAYLLNVRADTPLDATPQEQIADLVWANRLRLHVLKLCEEKLQAIIERERRKVPQRNKLKEDQEKRDRQQKFWYLATMAEAYLGLGELDKYESTRAEAEELAPPIWMMRTFNRQSTSLRKLLEKHGHLLNPPWPSGRTSAPR